MSIDPAPLAKLAASLIDELEEEYGEDAELVDAVILVEVSHRDEDDDAASTVRGLGLSGRNTAAAGVLVRGLRAVLLPELG